MPTAREPDWVESPVPTATPSGAHARVPSTDRRPGVAPDPETASLGEIVGELSRDFSRLVRQEVALAKAEATQSAKEAGKGAGMFAGAGVAGHMVLLFLSVALWWGLGSLMGRGWSAVVVALVWAVVAAVLYLRGRAEVRRVKGLPQTTDSLKKIPNALQGHEERNS
ncbi:phage holin family protein [Antribacter gilvus]|uniref:phage holin family protein n=1 Tax=Antribacter gilvus TaxID=2304675 RepID=UPI000F776B8A|nr:phage holin family protein [Antribacter gilvus]